MYLIAFSFTTNRYLHLTLKEFFWYKPFPSHTSAHWPHVIFVNSSSYSKINRLNTSLSLSSALPSHMVSEHGYLLLFMLNIPSLINLVPLSSYQVDHFTIILRILLILRYKAGFFYKKPFCQRIKEKSFHFLLCITGVF